MYCACYIRMIAILGTKIITTKTMDLIVYKVDGKIRIGSIQVHIDVANAMTFSSLVITKRK